MRVHNIMEEYVEKRVNMFYDRLIDEKATWLRCDCDVCRSDTLGFVLNRVSPRYVVSSRGISHNSDLMDDAHVRIDVDTLINRGAHIINSAQRAYHAGKPTNNHIVDSEIKTPSFNFPVFSGKIYNGETFEGITNVKITLKNASGMPAEMFDFTWENPCVTYKFTDGGYTFWVKPLPAAEAGITQTFHFTVSAEYEDYLPTTYGFEISVKSDDYIRKTIDSTFSLKIPDLFMFKTEE